jgi:outer membrane protein TolC
LLGGFAASARRQLLRAEHTFEAEKARYDQQTLAVSAEVERSYWELYAAERDYAVQTLIREQAELFLRETELRAKAGLIGPNQVANAKTFLAEQELLLLEREEQLAAHSDRLAALMGVRPQAGSPRFIAADEPPHEFPVESVEVLVQRALENNLNLQAARQDVEAMRALASAARWEVLPRVDLVGSVGGTGLSGAAQDVIFGSDTLRTTRSGSFSDAILQTRRRDFPNWSVGVEVSIPIGFRTGLGESDRLDAEVVGAEQRFLEQSRALEQLVRGAYRELYHGKRRLEAALEGVKAAEEQGRIGLIEFHNGRSTAFELVRLGADFAMAQRRYSEALVRTAKAAATLRQLTSGGYPAATNQ